MIKTPSHNVVTFLNLQGNAGEHKNQLYWFTHINSNQKQMHMSIAKVIFLMQTCLKGNL